MKNVKIKIDPLVASLLPDSDKKMGAIASASMVVALALCLLATTYEQMVDDVIFLERKDDELIATINVIEKKEEKKELPKKEMKSKKEIQRKRQGGGGKPKGQGRPNAVEARSVLKMLTAMTKSASNSSYDLIKQKFAKDIDKVIKSSSGLQLTGKTHFGDRRGTVTGGINEGYASGGSGGIDGLFTGLQGGSVGALSTKSLKGNLRPPSAKEIDMGAGTSSRSASDVMKVIRKRTPGLRHVYNKYLKMKPGFAGKVTFKFIIAPGGEIIGINIISSTTGYSEFDNEIKNSISRWTFGTVKSGNTTVTVPFTFSE